MQHAKSWTRSFLFLVAPAVVTACAVGTGAENIDGQATTNLPSLPTPSTAAGPVSTADASGHDASLPDAAEADAGHKADAATSACLGYAAPTETATCKCPAGKMCDANHCFGGYYCELTATPPKCVHKPASCP